MTTFHAFALIADLATWINAQVDDVDAFHLAEDQAYWLEDLGAALLTNGLRGLVLENHLCLVTSL